MSELEVIAIAPSIGAQPREESAIAVAASLAGAIGILDIEHKSENFDLKEALTILQSVRGKGTGIKCGVTQIPGLIDAICSVTGQWVRGKSTEGQDPRSAFAEHLRNNSAASGLKYIILSMAGLSGDKLSCDCRNSERLAGVVASAKEFKLQIFAEVVDTAEAVIAENAGVDAIIAKGNESPGRVGEETAFVLLQRLVKTVKLPVWVEGGIGTHTVGACLIGGAYGVVLESQLLLAKESPVPPELRVKLRRMDGSETQLVKASDGNHYRIHPANNGLSIGELTQQVEELLSGNRSSSVFLGQSAAFAESLASRGRTVSGIIAELRKSLTEHLELARLQNVLLWGSPLAQSHATEYPIVQGAMTRVSDTAEFACNVAQGGALPFLALALMRKAEIEKLLSRCKSTLKEHSWGVGLLGFVPEPLWHEQLEAVAQAKPPYAIIAGGRPDQSKLLEQAGIKSYLHVPSPLLLKAFIDEGARRFIFEGSECGGHVGPRSSFVLWQLMIDVLLEKIGTKSESNAGDYHVIFAGGIHDSVSAAMTATLAAPLANAGVRIGMLLGTAYLFTQEAVSSGAIVKTFQEKALKCNTTALLETGPGHSIRVIDSPYRETFEASRTQLRSQNKSREEIREQLELMNLGRLRAASKGLMRAAESESDAKVQADEHRSVTSDFTQELRNPESIKLVPVSDDQQWRDGMYMIGQVAALHDRTLTIKQLHKDISETGSQHLKKMLDVLEQLDVLGQAAAKRSEVQRAGVLATDYNENYQSGEQLEKDIAIVGMACMLPQANDIEKFWLNILNRVDSIGEVPETYWSWKRLYDPDPLARDKIISKWGGFLEAIEFDPTAYGIPPSSMGSVDSMQLLILETARLALIDAGYEERDFPKSKTSVILANAGHGPITAMYSLRSMLDWKLAHLPLEQRKQLEQMLPEWTEDSFPGYLGNVTAGRVSNRFDLGGLNFSIDAACASSLAALYVGVNDLRSGGSDVVLLAATDTHNQPGDYLSFSKTHALSPEGRCKTFDAGADGIVISEGIAVLVLKRLADAERDGDTIYALVRGVGGSSDGRALSLTAPRPQGQTSALSRAYEDSGVRPSTVTLVEAHGTGTVVGDKAEIEALGTIFANDGAGKQVCAVGSVKSNIGHTKSTAGLASLIKAAKALHHKVLPPTIGVKNPNPSCKFADSPFYINSECRPWLAQPDGRPRRAGVSAFGFGGTNFHVVLEEYAGPTGVARKSASAFFPSELFVFRANSYTELKKQITHFESDLLSQAKLVSDTLPLLALSSFKLFLRNVEHGYGKDHARANAQARASGHAGGGVHAHGNVHDHAGITLTIVAASVDDLLKKLQSVSALSDDQISRGLQSPQGIYLRCNGGTDSASDAAGGASNANGTNGLDTAVPGKIAFLFPGQGSQRVNMLRDLCLYFPLVRNVFEQADRVYADEVSRQRSEGLPKNLLSNYIFPPPTFTEEQAKEQQDLLTDTAIAQAAMGVADLAMYKLLREFTVVPDMLAGHSYGEYVALAAAGAIGDDSLLRISLLRGKLMSRCVDGAMAAVTGSVPDIESIVSEFDGVTLANYNAPQQAVLSGPKNEIDSALTVLCNKGFDARLLPVSAAFHSPAMQDVCRELEGALSQCNFSAPSLAVYSNLSGLPHNYDAASIVGALVEHAAKPVRFMQEIEQMYADGARTFIEVGPGSVLTNLVDGILQDKPHTAISTDRPGRHGLVQLQHALAVLSVNGLNVDLAALYKDRYQELEAVEQSLKRAKDAASKRNSVRYLVNSYSIKRIGECVSEGAGNNSGQKQLTPVGGQIDRQVVVHQNENAGPATSTRDHGSGYSPGQAPAAVVQEFATAQVNDAGADRVMLQFQQTMSQMTNNFLQAQQNVMLAYLNRGAGAVSAPAPSLLPIPQFVSQMPSAPQDVQLQPGQLSSRPTISDRAAPAAMVSAVAPVPTTTLNVDELIAGLIEIVSERTGYPPEMLEPHLDLEADLGIDSIKRIEILSTFRKMLPPEKIAQLEGSVEKLASTRTLAGIFDWIREAAAGEVRQGRQVSVQDGQANLQDEQVSVQDGQARVQEEQVRNGQVEEVHARLEASESVTSAARSIGRGLVEVVKLPKTQTDVSRISGLNTENGTAPEVVLVADGVACSMSTSNDSVSADVTTRTIADRLGQRGFNAILLNDVMSKAETTDHEFANENKIKVLLESLKKQHGKIAGLVYVGAEDASADSVVELAGLLKVLGIEFNESGSRANPFVIAALRLGGTFGFDNSGLLEGASYEQAGIAGLIKAISREWPQIRSRVVDFETSAEAAEIADRLADEIMASDNSHIEIGYAGGMRFGLQIKKASTPILDSSSSIELDNSSVILLTGGARGITAQLSIALAQCFQPTMVLVGRQQLPTTDEPSEFKGLNSLRELKAAIIEKLKRESQPVALAQVEHQYNKLLKDREIRATLSFIQNVGAKVQYHCLDVRDESAFEKLIDDVYEAHGRLDGVIHGAGIIEDAYLINKQIDSFKRVFDTKVIPARVLARKLNFDRLQFMFFLSSIVSRTGNAGQADYVAANEVLNKLAVQLNRTNKGTRVASLLWGPWNAGMARPELESIFASYGWTMIDFAQGREAFMRELMGGRKDDEEVLLVAVNLHDGDERDGNGDERDHVADSGHVHVDGNGRVYADGNGHGHDDGSGRVHTDDNGHVPADGNGHDSNVIVRANGARLFNSYALEKMDNAIDVHFNLSTEEDLYLNDHRLNGLPVLPMAMATELLVEAGCMLDGSLRTGYVRNLTIPSGVIFDEASKNFVIRIETGNVDKLVKVSLSSVGSKETPAPSRVRFRSDLELVSNSNQQIKECVAQKELLPQGIPLFYEPQQFISPDNSLPTTSEAYQKWFFHGPTFQGIQEILGIGADGISGTVLSSSPSECLKSTNGESWAVDPILLDSAMQLAGVWAWRYLDMMVLPTGFRALSLFKTPTRQVYHVIVKMPQLPHVVAATVGGVALTDAASSSTVSTDHSELFCDLAIYEPSGQIAMLLEGLSGIGSRSFNRLVENPKELRSQ